MKPRTHTLLLTQLHRPFGAAQSPLLPTATQEWIAPLLAAGQGLVPDHPEYQVMIQFPAAGACYFSLAQNRQRVLVGAAGRSQAGSAVVWEALGHLLLPKDMPAWTLPPPRQPWLAMVTLLGPDELPLKEARELRGFAVTLALGFLSERSPESSPR